MPLLIDNAVVNNHWVDLSEEMLELPIPAGDIVVPLSFYLECSADLLAREGRIGVKVNGDDDFSLLYPALSHISMVAIEFPVLRDGRGYSIARQLVRLGYQGEIRAVGDVAHDRLAFMQSSGFNAFLIPDERFLEDDLSVFDEISVNYQGTAVDPRPIFRR